MPLTLSDNIDPAVREALKGPPGSVWFGLERACGASVAEPDWQRVEVPAWGKNSKYWPVGDGVLEVAARIGVGVYRPSWTREDKRSRISTGPAFALAPDGSVAIAELEGEGEDIYDDEDGDEDDAAKPSAPGAPTGLAAPSARAPAAPAPPRPSARAASTIDGFLPADREGPLAMLASVMSLMGGHYEHQLRLTRELFLDAQRREEERSRLFLQLEERRAETQREFFTSIIRASQGRDEAGGGSALTAALAPIVARLDAVLDDDEDDDPAVDPVALARQFAAELQGPNAMDKIIAALNSPIGGVVAKGLEQFLASRGVSLPPGGTPGGTPPSE